MNDTLKYFSPIPFHRKYQHNKLTFTCFMPSPGKISFLPFFARRSRSRKKIRSATKCLETCWQQFANLRLLYAYQCAHPGKKLLFMARN